MSDILAATAWPTNAELIADCARLGYLKKEWRTLDPTYGYGTFWKTWQPQVLQIHDIKTDGVDFRALPYDDRSFDCIVFDPPYKLNGTPSESDERYGVDVVMSIRDRHALMIAGLRECIRVFNRKGFLLAKCQDQVASGRVHWQTHMLTTVAESAGLRLVDALLMLTRPRPQRSQVHARRNYSTMLVFR